VKPEIVEFVGQAAPHDLGPNPFQAIPERFGDSLGPGLPR
jgi:hypothetical protein